MQHFNRIFLALAGLALLALAAGVAMQNSAIWQPSAVALSVTLALGIAAFPALKTFRFTLWIIVAVTAAMIYPGLILHKYESLGGFDLKNKYLILIVIQMVMFGMGTQMSLSDLAGVAKQPRGVLVGIVCHFSIMPLVGFGLTKVFHFPPEIAAGIILIGSCSSGLASNVMAYIARSNLALSVTVTAITTLVAPIMTPLLFRWLAPASLKMEMSFYNQVIEIVKIVLVPISAALLHDYLKHAGTLGRGIVYGLAAYGAVWLIALLAGGWSWLEANFGGNSLTSITLFGFMLGAVVAGVLYHALSQKWDGLDRLTPIASMIGIVFFTVVTTASGRDALLSVGALLFIASVIHNAAGYFFGYWLSRGAGLDKNSARSVAFEVGLQNGGMASGLANAMGKLATVGLAPAIFSPWMNVSGSILANWWRRRPVGPEPGDAASR